MRKHIQIVWICPECSFVLDKESEYCPSCGAGDGDDLLESVETGISRSARVKTAEGAKSPPNSP